MGAYYHIYCPFLMAAKNLYTFGGGAKAISNATFKGYGAYRSLKVRQCC